METITVPGLMPGETAHPVALSDTESTIVVVRVTRTTDPSIVAGEPRAVLRVESYEVDADGLVVQGDGGVSGPPPLYVDLSELLRVTDDPAAALARLADGLREDAVTSARRYIMGQRALAALPLGTDFAVGLTPEPWAAVLTTAPADQGATE